MKSFGKLPRNARFCIAVEPLWALFGPMVSYFMPLFQKELGLSEVQMGVVNSANIAAGFLFFALAAPITNKLGRRATSLWFDFIAWSLAMVIWALSRSYIWFLVAAVCNAVVKIVIVSWNLLISEDADEHQRATIFGWVNVIGTFGGFSTFVGGLLIARFGLLPSMRTIFLVGAVAMTLMFVLRYVGTRETEVGVYLKEKYKKESFLKLAATQLPKAKQALRDPFFARMTAIYFIANAVLTIDFFRVLYLREEKGLSPFAISAIPALSAIVSIIVFFFVLPRQKSVKNHSHLANSFLLCTGAQILFMLIPRGSWLAAIVIFPSLQTFYALLQTFRDTVFMNGTDPEHKSERFSLIQAFMLLFSIPIGWISGLLYSLSPHLPFVLSSCLYAAGFVLAIGLNENPKPVKAENSR